MKCANLSNGVSHLKISITLLYFVFLWAISWIWESTFAIPNFSGRNKNMKYTDVWLSKRQYFSFNFSNHVRVYIFARAPKRPSISPASRTPKQFEVWSRVVLLWFVVRRMQTGPTDKLTCIRVATGTAPFKTQSWFKSRTIIEFQVAAAKLTIFVETGGHVLFKWY